MEVFRLMGKIAVDNKDANKKIEDTTEKASGLSSVLSKIGEGTIKFGNTMLKAGSIIGTAWVASVEGSREYRTEMGKLNTAFTAAGYATNTAAAAYKALYGVIGQTDQAVEAAQQIALLAQSEKDVAEWSALAAGVVGRFGDALQPETFFESANETMKLCEATGAYVQMLEGMGVSVDEFNAGLAACNTEAEKQAYMLGVTKSLLGDASQAYNENNKDIIDSNRAHSDMADNMAKLGEMSEPVLTKLIDGINKMAEFALPQLESALQWMMDNGEATALAIGAIATSMAVAAVAAHPYAAAVTAIVAALAMMKASNADGDAYNHFFNRFSDAEMAALQNYVETAREAKQAEEELYNALDAGVDTKSAEDALTAAQYKRDAAKAEAEAIDGLIAAYNSWRSGQAASNGGEIWLDVPMRVSEDSEQNAQNDIDGMSLEGVVKLVADTSGLQAAVNATGLSASVGIYQAGGTVDSSNAVGLDRVPRDGWLARVHKDEAILDKTDANIWRGGGIGRIETLLKQLVANTRTGQRVVLDSGVLVGQLAPALDTQLGTISSRKGRRN
jgi:hypothetical protein